MITLFSNFKELETLNQLQALQHRFGYDSRLLHRTSKTKLSHTFDRDFQLYVETKLVIMLEVWEWFRVLSQRHKVTQASRE